MVVEGLYYTKEHEWVKIDGDMAIIGITDHAQEMLGEITYVELPKLDKEVDAGDDLAVVESSKAASDVYAPVAGRVVEVNPELETRPELINEDCYDTGWIIRWILPDKLQARRRQIFSPSRKRKASGKLSGEL
jgi:glycine cleavage system H protein